MISQSYKQKQLTQLSQQRELTKQKDAIPISTCKIKKPPQVLFKTATAAAVAALIMTPSVVAFAEHNMIPGEKLPVQVQTENSAIEQPTDPQSSEPRSVPSHPVVPQEHSYVPKVWIKVDGESKKHHKDKEHRKERFYERQQEQPELRAAPKSSETITPSTLKPVTSTPAIQIQPSAQTQAQTQSSAAKFSFSQSNDENHHQELSHPQAKPESSSAVGQMPAAFRGQVQNHPTAPASQTSETKGSTETPATSKPAVSDHTVLTADVRSGGNTETSAAQPGTTAPIPRIEVKGKLPKTASPYPVQMLSSLGITLAGIAGLRLSKRKNPR